MDRQYLIPPALISLVLYIIVLGVVCVNLCDYSDTWSIILNWGLVIILACIFNIYVIIPYGILWWGSLFCNTDGYSIGAVLLLTLMTVAATFIASIVHQTYGRSKKPNKKTGKNEELNRSSIIKCILLNIVSPPAAALIGSIVMICIILDLSSKKK
jgi:hypothetical protein